uniref:Uncharacterized protein n=1 Tax=Falco tinnunculus TaxID=100819 RepID=A0A8C4U0K5_FALTI
MLQDQFPLHFGPTHPDFANFLLADGDLLAVDLDVGQADIGDGFHPTTDVILALHLEGHQCGVVPAGFSHGVGAGALEVKIEPIEGAVVGVAPSPASVDLGWDTLDLAVLHLTPLLGPALKGFAGVWKEEKLWEKPWEVSCVLCSPLGFGRRLVAPRHKSEQQ